MCLCWHFDFCKEHLKLAMHHQGYVTPQNNNVTQRWACRLCSPAKKAGRIGVKYHSADQKAKVSVATSCRSVWCSQTGARLHEAAKQSIASEGNLR